MSSRRPEKICATCGRSFSWRRRWEHSWDEVRHCSAACRHAKPRALDRALERAILDLLDRRARDATACPSEAARRVLGEDWREGMERTREAARRLVSRGELEMVQRGCIVDPSRARGPIRLRRVRARG